MLHRLGRKVESYVYRNLKSHVNYEVAPVVRPILSVDVLTSKGVLVVFGVEEDSSFIQLDGYKIPMIRENGAMVLYATLVDGRDMTGDLVAPVVPTEVPVVGETRDEAMGDSGNLSEYQAPQIHVLKGARGVNRSKHPSEADRRTHVQCCTICCTKDCV